MSPQTDGDANANILILVDQLARLTFGREELRLEVALEIPDLLVDVDLALMTHDSS
jgi:hypothetical protein